MEILNISLTWNLAALATAAFVLGACPFALWVGKLFLKTDVRRFGDGNPGATNVFRAGNIPLGILAVSLDIGKGIPFVVLGRVAYDLGPWESALIGMAAVLGHAFSPLLGFKGGKALAVTAGVVIGFGYGVLFWSFFLSALIFISVLEDRAWLVVLTPISCLTYLILVGASGGYVLFMLGLAVLFAFKQSAEIRHAPRLKSRLTSLFQTRRPV
jgi:acyl phosphate:glycerol-3-phosphate acyltransferase